MTLGCQKKNFILQDEDEIYISKKNYNECFKKYHFFDKNFKNKEF